MDEKRKTQKVLSNLSNRASIIAASVEGIIYPRGDSGKAYLLFSNTGHASSAYDLAMTLFRVDQNAAFNHTDSTMADALNQNHPEMAQTLPVSGQREGYTYLEVPWKNASLDWSNFLSDLIEGQNIPSNQYLAEDVYSNQHDGGTLPPFDHIDELARLLAKRSNHL